MLASGRDESTPRLLRRGEEFFALIDSSPAPPTGEPPLVLIHGFTGHRDDFIAVAPQLAHKRRVIIPDLRGHGDSVSKPGALGWSFDQLVKDVVEFDDDFLPGADLFENPLPHARRITLLDAEHHPHQENNSAWLAAVETHLDTVGQTNIPLAGHTRERTGA